MSRASHDGAIVVFLAWWPYGFQNEEDIKMKPYPQQPGEHYYSQQQYPYETEQAGARDEYAVPTYPPNAEHEYYYQQQRQLQEQQVYDRRMNDRRAQPDDECREMFLMNLFLNGCEQRYGFGRRKEDYDKWLH
ncbi:hypothetical protein [Chitinivorax sp. B]|uniref:hypothetical protein n=1 Tax=Chitinivorax sp. B TaxID=2502235 RepID=UPI0010F76BAB|nr:hypothetical protein [Chitinivorax sp. B]